MPWDYPIACRIWKADDHRIRGAIIVGTFQNWEIRDKLLQALNQAEAGLNIRDRCFGEHVQTSRIASFTEKIRSSSGEHSDCTDEEIQQITKKLFAKLQPKIDKVADVISDFDWE